MDVGEGVFSRRSASASVCDGRNDTHVKPQRGRTRWRLTFFWDSLLKTRHSSHKVCNDINQSFQHGHTRATGPTRERTRPLTPKQEVLLTGCILGNSEERISLQLLADAVKRNSPSSHGYLVRGASHARHLFDVAVATRTEGGAVGAGVAVHLPVNLHGFSVGEEEDTEN